ncbi:MAG: gamma-glutamyltransferase [Candidatus Rokubacteria bacterium]|nr:gamma-glutamyltransferase [Candidatus Rokubacteria bacterium]
MTPQDWRARAGTTFETEKRPANAARGMVVTNHPLASAAGAEMLAAGGNAVDAAVASLFALTVVEPMMVGVFGAGHAQLFLPGRAAGPVHTVIDGYTTAPAAATADMYRPVSDSWPDYMEAKDRENTVGLRSVGVPGTLAAWCEMLARFGTLDLAAVMAPAIRHAERGFRVTGYLSECLAESATDLARFPDSARVFLPGGAPIEHGDLLVQADCAATLRAIAADGPAALYGGAVGRRVVEHMAQAGGLLTLDDLGRYRTVERAPVRGTYRGFEIAGCPPPTGGGIHLIQILNVLEAYDVAALGYGTIDGMHLLAEALKIAFADRAVATGDPAFVDVPVAKLVAKDYAAVRRAAIDMAKAGAHVAGVAAGSPHTTHVTVADADGNVVAATQTINSLFGSKAMAPGTGMLLNNTMALFDPHPGHTLSAAPGKRMTSSMAPTIVLRDGHPVVALGLPGGVRIFTSVLQALVNLIDHGMTLQEAVEAPRMWTQGQEVEVETAVAQSVRAGLTARGHHVVPVAHVAGGMGAIMFMDDGSLTGASCWRADGTPIGIGGGHARPGIRFWPDRRTAPPA